jgi:nucleotide-binding universal stress UspA family protein
VKKMALPTGTDKEIREEAQRVLDWQVEEITKAGGDITKAHLRVGKPDEEILRLSEEIVAGLIVVGTPPERPPGAGWGSGSRLPPLASAQDG